MKGDKLTIKQELFAQKVVEGNTDSDAYRAVYSVENMKPETIHQEAHQLRKLHKVSLRIEELSAMRLKRHELTADKVINELQKLAFLDTRKAFDEDGNIKPIHELDDDTAAAVAGIEFEEVFEGRGESRTHTGRIHKIKLSDKARALEMLGKNLKLFTDRVETGGIPEGAPIKIENINNPEDAAAAYQEMVKGAGFLDNTYTPLTIKSICAYYSGMQ